MKGGKLEEGDLVYPSDSNPHKFNKNAKFPWKIIKISETGLQLTLEHISPSGKRIRDKWWIGFWQIEPYRNSVNAP